MQNNTAQDKIEIFFGGGMALVAVCAIVVKMALNGFSFVSVLDGVTDFAQVVVAAMILLIALKRILNRRPPVETFESTLGNELQSWMTRNRPLVSREDRPEKGSRFFMLTDLEHIFDVGENLSNENTYKKGRFVELPLSYEAGAEMHFFLNLSTFRERAIAKNSESRIEVQLLAARVSACINANFSELLTASSDNSGSGGAAAINITFVKDLDTPEDARQIIHLIDYVMTLYMVAA